MGDWFTNPVVWIGAITALVIVGRVVFRVGQWKGKVDEAQSTFKISLDTFMVEIRADVKRIFERIGPATATSGSPIRLTDLGRKIADRLDAGAIADSLVPRLEAEVAGMLAYEIQERCFKYVREEYKPPPEVQTLILQCAFDNGIDREQVMKVIAIELRDRLLPRQEE